VQLLAAHVKYTDLASLRVGIPQLDGSFMSLTLRFLAKQAGIGLRRAERAMRDLQHAGLIRTWQRCEVIDGQYRGIAALRQLPATLFGAFGLGTWLKHERSKAAMRCNLTAAAAAKAKRCGRKEAQAELFLNGLQHQFNGVSRLSARKAAPANPELEEQVRRRIGVLKQHHPEWDRDTCYAHAYRELVPATGPPAGSSV